MDPECLLEHSLEPATGTYPQWNIRVGYMTYIITPCFLLINLNIILLSISRSSSWGFPSFSLLNFILISRSSHDYHISHQFYPTKCNNLDTIW
jgi:hypothetical protein